MSSDSRPYRQCVGLALFNRAGLVFAGRRHGFGEDSWQMPQGGIDPGETPRQAALRELLEEVGTGKAEILAESSAWYSYDFPAELGRRSWGGKYRGQSQRWFALAFTGADAEINIATAHPEFDDWKWMELEAMIDRIIPFKREVYRAVIQEFAPIAKLLSAKT